RARITRNIRRAEIGFPVVHRDVGQRGFVGPVATIDVVPKRGRALILKTLIARACNDATVLVIAANMSVAAIRIFPADIVPIPVGGENGEVLTAGQIADITIADGPISPRTGEVFSSAIQGLSQRRIALGSHSVQMIEPVLPALSYEQTAVGIHRNDVGHRAAEHLLISAAWIETHEANAIVFVQRSKGFTAAGFCGLHARTVVLVPIGVIQLLCFKSAHASLVCVAPIADVGAVLPPTATSTWTTK